MIIGNITVKIKVNNLADNIDHIKFNLDGELQHMDGEAPYYWEWNQPSFRRHILSVTASINSENALHSQRVVWKIL